MNPKDIIVARIIINIMINENDTLNDIQRKILKCIKKSNLYNCIRSVVIEKYSSDADKLNTKLTQLNRIRDDYDLTLSQFNNLIEQIIPFYNITTNDKYYCD